MKTVVNMQSDKSQIAEAIITGHSVTEGKKDTAGWVSSLVCRLSDKSVPGEFKVRYQGIGAPAVGTTLMLNFYARTKAGLPLNAKFRVIDAPKEELNSLVELADKCKEIVQQDVRTAAEQALLDSLVETLADDLAEKARIQEPVKTIEQLRAAHGMHLQPGDHVKVSGTSGGVHTVTMSAKGHLYCSCPGWKFQRVPIESRTCKHCDAVACD